MQKKMATVFGGTGFVGRQIVGELVGKGYEVRVATRAPERVELLKQNFEAGQVSAFQCHYHDAQSITEAVRDAQVVVNCVGLLFEKGKQNRFEHAHVDLPKMIAHACEKEGIGSFVHISALGVDKATSKYAQTKFAGEKAILDHFSKAVILRPSVIFGEDDSFFNMFADMARYVPVLPLIGGGETKFQPVFVGDVADAVMASIANADACAGQVYELGGPDVVTFKDIYHILFKHTGRKRCLMTLPFGLAKFQGTLMSVLPKPPLTHDQVESLKTDNIVADNAQDLQALGVQATAMDVILPKYLESYRAGG